MNPSSKSNKSKSKKVVSLAVLASEAVSYLSKAQAVLPIDDDLIERDRSAAVATVRFPTAALATTVAILEKEPDRFPQFSLADARDALAYDQAMSGVIAHAEALVSTLKTSLLKRRAAGIERTLALYAWVKREARTDGTVVKYVDALAPDLVLTRRKGKSTKAKPATPTGPSAPGPTPEPPTPRAPVASVVSTNGASAPAVNGSSSTNGASAPATAH